MTISVYDPLREPRISKIMPGGPADLQQYVMEICDGILDFEAEAGKWAYTYHGRIAGQLPAAIDELRRDPNSRRAVISLVRETDWCLEDQPCLQHIQFMIRGGKLDMFALFRSNDVLKATFMNAFALIELQRRVADELGVAVGTYTHRANSFHAYERDWPTLEAAAERYARSESLSYFYEGEWREMMDAAKPEIWAKVDELRRRNEK